MLIAVARHAMSNAVRLLLFASVLSACSSRVGSADPDAAGGTADADVSGQHDAAALPPQPDAGGGPQRPALFLAASNYLEQRDELRGYGPFVVYAWATDPALSNPQQYDRELSALAAINDPDVVEIVMFSSYRTLSDKLSQPGHADYLRSIGVTGFGFNSEGFMTPADQMNSLGDTDPSTNAVARFSSIAQAAGFDVLWGPIRVTADAVGDPALATMFGAGLDGVGLQEQQFIESACVDDRAAAVAATAARYRAMAASEGGSAQIDVQIMPSRCLSGDTYAAAHCGTAITADYDHCAQFAAAIADQVDSIGIWASSPTDRAGLVPLVRRLRGQ